MPVSKLAEMTWEEVRELDPDSAIAILPVGAVEAHGPHLPLATDIIIADAMARAGAERLSARGHRAVILPPLAYTHAGFAAGFPGTVNLRPESVRDAVIDIARGLAAHGVRTLAIANAHLDPGHLKSLHDAVEAIRDDGDIRIVFPDLTRKPWALRLGDEFRSGACHAGQYESSIVMAERPDLVRDDVRSSLPDVERSLSEAILAGHETFEEAGGGRAYFGFPARASAEEGQDVIRELGAILEEAVQDGS